MSRSVTGSLVKYGTLSAHKLSSNTGGKASNVRHYWTFKLCGLSHAANLSTLEDRMGYIHITNYGPVLATQRDPVTATTSVPLHSPKQTKRDVVLKAECASALRQCRGQVHCE